MTEIDNNENKENNENIENNGIQQAKKDLNQCQ